MPKVMRSVIDRTAEHGFRVEPATYEQAEEAAGFGLDRRRNYWITQDGDVEEEGVATLTCSGCSCGCEGGCGCGPGFGCSECGYTGKRRFYFGYPAPSGCLSPGSLRTNRGLVTCERTLTGAISVSMGKPLTAWSDVPLALEMDTLALPLAGAPTACSMGNPHCTYFVDDLTAVEIATIGPTIETNPLFPLRTNVHFVQIIDRKPGYVFGSAGVVFR